MRLCGYKNGGDRKSEGQNDLLKLSEIAKQLGISEKSLKRILSIERNLTESMKELLDTGTITRTLAADTIASLSEDEQEELLKRLDITQKITKREVQQYIDRIKQLNPIKKENDIYESTLKISKRRIPMKEKWRNGKRKNEGKRIVFPYIRKKVVPDGEEYDTS